MKRYYPTGIENISAMITIPDSRGEGAYVLRGCLVFQDTLWQLSTVSGKQISCPSKENEEKYVYMLIGRLREAYSQTEKPLKIKTEVHDGIYSDAYQTFTSKHSEKDLYLGIPWCDSTAHRYIVYFERNILKRLDKCGANLDAHNMAIIAEELAKKSKKNKRSKDPVIAQRNVQSFLAAANILLRCLVMHNPDLPRVYFECEHIRVPANEQIKALPDMVRVVLAMLLRRLISNGMSLGVAFMLFCGLRSSEAAAPLWEEIIEKDGYALYYVRTRYSGGKRINVLKSMQAYRVVIIPYYMMTLLEERKAHLLAKGYTWEQLKKAPIASMPHDAKEYCGDKKLSSYAAILLKACGFTINSVQQQKLMQESDDYDESEQDPHAYILRRDWCSRAANICGLSPDTVDYLMGHANKIAKKRDYITDDATSIIAKKLERYVFDPGFSLNPAYKPICITDMAENIELGQYCDTQLVCVADAGTKVHVTIDVQCVEPNDGIVIATNRAFDLHEHIVMPDAPEMRSARALFGSSNTDHFFDICKAKANEISITGLIS